MKSTISSRLTFFCKFVFPALWIFFSGVNIINSNIDRDFSIDGSFLLIVGSALILGISVMIKKVEIDYAPGVRILVSNYHKVIEVQPHDIESISGSMFFVPELIWINLKKPSEFGKKIFFIPQHRPGTGFSVHPLVKDLKTLTGII